MEHPKETIPEAKSESNPIKAALGEYATGELFDGSAEARHAEITTPELLEVLENSDSHTGSYQLGLTEAEQLMSDGYVQSVIKHIERFNGLDHSIVADKFLDQFGSIAFLHVRHRFSNLNSSVARKLLGMRRGDVIFAESLSYFHDLDSSIVEELVPRFLSQVINNMPHFNGSVGKYLLPYADNLASDIGIANSVVDNFASLTLRGDDAYKVLDACRVHYSASQKIKNLDLESIVGAERAAELREAIEAKDLETMSVAQNPYAEKAGDVNYFAVTRPGQNIHKKVREIDRELRKPSSPEYQSLANVAVESFDALKSNITAEFGEEYANRILGDSEHSHVRSTYRRLIADFLAAEDKNSYGERSARLRTELNARKDGRRAPGVNEAFQNALSIDTKYYDKLFTEWDANRVGQKEFQEVFLGRDGVYAYVGRRAQLFARRRMLGVGDNEDADGQLNFPDYLVYPRGFRDELNSKTKGEYLNGKITNPSAARYYDTGFTGTIPEDIMRTLGLPEEEYEKRIRLLSATKRDRTVLGVEGSAKERIRIVNAVEHNAKDEETAEGLYMASDGQLEYYAQPSSPLDRLNFRMIQLALHRHYYTQEFLKNQDQKGYTFESEQLSHEREMRVDRALPDDITKMLSDIFSADDIGAELLGSAVSLKIANPEDPYPDEAVFELELGSTHLIVKSVGPNRQEGPIDEFEALLLMKRLGIDAPRPAARIFTEGQKGFVVIEKLEGQSGRNTRKYFEQQAITEDNQREIMGDALDRMESVAEIIRRDTGLDKSWSLKDFVIEYETIDRQLKIKTMRPVNFEGTKVFDPEQPQAVALGQGFDELL